MMSLDASDRITEECRGVDFNGSVFDSFESASDAKKAASLRIGNRSFSVQKPLPINALNALRDGASCSEGLGIGLVDRKRAGEVNPARIVITKELPASGDGRRHSIR